MRKFYKIARVKKLFLLISEENPANTAKTQDNLATDEATVATEVEKTKLF